MLYQWTISERRTISDKKMTISGNKKAIKEQKKCNKYDNNMIII